MFESHLYWAFRSSAQNIILVEVRLNKSLTEKKPLRMMFFQDRNTQVICLETSKFLSTLIKLLLKAAFLLINLQKVTTINL